MKNTIMLLEDADVDALIAQKILEKTTKNCHLLHFSDASSATKYLSKLSASDFPKVILVDLMMPVVDGFSFLDTYEKEFFPKKPASKVIVLTSSVDKRDKLKVKSMRCIHDFWVKPFSKDMAEKLSSLL